MKNLPACKEGDSSFKTVVFNGKRPNRFCKFVHASTPNISKIVDNTKNSQAKLNPNFLEPFDIDDNDVAINSSQFFSVESFSSVSENLEKFTMGIEDPDMFFPKGYSEVDCFHRSQVSFDTGCGNGVQYHENLLFLPKNYPDISCPENNYYSHLHLKGTPNSGNNLEFLNENTLVNFENTPQCTDMDTPSQLFADTSAHTPEQNFRDDVSSEEINKIKEVKQKHVKNVTLGYININSIRNKFNDLKLIVKDYIDILIIAETKIDASFPTSQFLLKEYNCPFRLDISDKSGGLLVYVKKGIAARPLFVKSDCKNMQVISIELHLKSSKWLLISIYRPEYVAPATFLCHLNKIIELHKKKSEKMIIIGDFNMLETHPDLKDFLEAHNLYNLIKGPTCFKSIQNPTAIDHILTNRKYSFIETQILETGLSDFHKMVFTCMKSTFVKLPAKKLSYRDYKNFDKDKFLAEIDTGLQQVSMMNYKNLISVTERILEKHAPTKTKLVRGNDKTHMNKTLRKEIMCRSKLKNKANRTKAIMDFESYKNKKINACFLIKKQNGTK